MITAIQAANIASAGSHGAILPFSAVAGRSGVWRNFGAFRRFAYRCRSQRRYISTSRRTVRWTG